MTTTTTQSARTDVPAIQFVEDDGLYCPVFVCAQCGRPIHKEGIVAWDNYDSPTFVALHKGQCDWAYESRHGRIRWWRELDTFLAQLSHNTEHPFGEEAAAS